MREKIDKAVKTFKNVTGHRPRYIIMDHAAHFELANEVLSEDERDDLMVLELGVYNGMLLAVCYDQKFSGFELA